MQMAFKDFWRKNPALLVGLNFYFATLLSFGYLLPSLLFLPIALPVAFSSWRWTLVFLITFLFFGSFIPRWYQLPEGGSYGMVTLTIESIRPKKHLFSKKGWEYRGRVKKFVTADKTLYPHLPYSLFLTADQHKDFAKYEMMATVYHRQGRHLVIRPRRAQGWTPLSKKISVAKWRFLAKEWVKEQIHEHMASKKAATVLAALATGDLHDKVTRQEFRGLGLAHLMAISGFHFSLLAFFLHLLLRMIFPYPVCHLFLLILLTLYFFFMGSSASIERAYLMIAIYLIGQLIARRSFPLNSLGVALMITIAKDPISIFGLGFQFSYLATAALLILISPVKKCFEVVIPRRSFSEVIESPLWKKHVFVVLSILRDLLTLDIAVHLVVIPFSLSVFHTFSLSGLIYNLFFPFLITISLVLLLFGPLLMPINSYYTHTLLTLTEFKPPLLAKSVWMKSLPSHLLGVYFLVLFLGGILLNIDKKGGQRFGINNLPFNNHL